jgi:hypothetical protein
MQQQALLPGAVPWTTALTTHQAMSPALLWEWESRVVSSGEGVRLAAVYQNTQVLMQSYSSWSMQLQYHK